MLSDDRQKRLDSLRTKEADGTLTSAERSELSALYAQMDAEEAADQQAATERIKERISKLELEKAAAEKKAALLEQIAAEQERLLADAKAYLSRLHDRRTALADTYRRATGNELSQSR